MTLFGSAFLAGGATINVSATGSTNNYNIFVDAFGSPTSAGSYCFTIDSGVTIGSTSTATYALTVGNFVAGSTVCIINNGTVTGKGGAGGDPVPGLAGGAGAAGGHGLLANFVVEIFNNGAFYGGGGGGGAGGSGFSDGTKECGENSGGAGGDGQGQNSTQNAGQNVGRDVTPAAGGTGGAGGAYGVAGSTGGTGGTDGACPGKVGGNGGAAGRYSTTDSNVTWTIEGTRTGGVS